MDTDRSYRRHTNCSSAWRRRYHDAFQVVQKPGTRSFRPSELAHALSIHQKLDCSPRHIDRLAALGRMPAPVRVGTLVRWRRTNLAILVRELQQFQVKITQAAHETFGVWREGQHDDLVLAVALACWWAERHPPAHDGQFGGGDESLFADPPEGVFLT